MNPGTHTQEWQLTDEVADLRLRLDEATETLRAIQSGEVDAVVVAGPRGDQLFTLDGADDPYRVLIEEMNQGAVTLSAEGSILYCNRRFADLLKTPLEAIVGFAFAAFVAPAERAKFASLLEAGGAGGSAGEITLRAGDGSAAPLQLALGPLPPASAAAICLIATDISESKEKETRLRKTMADLVEAEREAEAARSEAERANAAKSEFLANMSHEIRTPMSGIIGMTDLALDTELNSEQRDYLGMVKSSAHSLLGLINGILDFSKIEAGKLELDSIDFSLRDCLGTLLKPLAIHAKKKGLRLTANISQEIPDGLIGDPMRLRQILINLIDNAIKFTKKGFIKVTVAAESDRGGGECLHFSVRDTGMGIPPEKREVIFEAFAQADGSTTRNYGGTGLGLAIAAQLVEQMRGKIWIESTVGEGTTFHFTAHFGEGRTPLPPEAAGQPFGRAAPVESPRTGSSLRILLAEDNVINRALATALLEKRGHSLVHAVNGREAVEAAANETFDLIFMDVQMPEMDGFEATHLIREMEQKTGRHTPIAAMTAHAMAGDRECCLAAGMDEYLSKPLDKPALLALLERIAADRSGDSAAPAPAPFQPPATESELEPECRIPVQRCHLIARLAGRIAIGIGVFPPFLFGWLCWQGLRSGWFGMEFGLASFAMANAATFVTLAWIGAAALRMAERREALVQDGLRRAQRDLERQVLQRTAELAEANASLHRQNLERAIAEHANQQIMDYSLDAICTIDACGRFLQVSRACEALWGRPAEDFIGRQYLDFVHPDDLEKTKAVAETIMAGAPEKDFENRYLRRDGSAVPLVWTAQWSEEQQIMFCVARDITVRKQMETELLQAKEAAEAAARVKGDFLANMSHEIRTPMNGIIGMTELVLETELDREQREFLGMAQSSALSLLGLINNILDFSKIEAGKLDLETIGFSLRGCIGAMLKPLGIRADQKGLELMADILAGVPDHVIGDPIRLRQILINLIDNAIKFTHRGDVTLRVAIESATDAAHCLRFSIADTGIGIQAGKQALIFEAFAQADGSTTRTYGGTGLGLAIAAQLVRQMGGRIWVESAVGEGTTFHFTVRLPVRDTPAPDVRHADARRLDGMRVLVVDDNAVNRRILGEMLANWQMQPAVLASAEAAIVEMLRAARAGTPFPLVILDGMMPGVDGFMLAEKIREHAELSGATVMMLSSAMPAGASARCGTLGVASYLTKPVGQAEMLDAILSALGGATQMKPVAGAAPIQRALNGLRILLAEDNAINNALATALLEKRGHSVAHAANGREALEATGRQTFDLIFMDLQMPEMDGFEATRRIREREQTIGRHTPIAAMTAHAMVGDRERCLTAGMDDYLSKPLQKEELLTLIARISAERNSAGSAAPSIASNGHSQPGDRQTFTLASSSGACPIFAREKLMDELDGDEALLRQMIALFHENTPRLLDDIRSAIARHSADELARSAHALLSSLGVFGAHDARRLTQQLEAQASQENYENTDQTFAALERGTAEIYTALAAFTAA